MTTQKDYVFQIDNKQLSIPIVQTYDENLGSFVWSSGELMANYIIDHRALFKNKTILELGCGPGLPGIVAAKIGARVILTDKGTPETLLRCCEMNCIINNVMNSCHICELEWGYFDSTFKRFPKLDYIIGSDIFYDSKLFDDILSTLSFLLQLYPNAQTLFVVQERVSLNCLVKHIKLWKLQYRFEEVPPEVLNQYQSTETLIYLYISK